MKRILLVDDEQRMLDLLKLYLEPHGYECEAVRSGKEALEQLDKQAYHIILLDIMMKDMNGFETCKHIRKRTDTPIIMVTARDQKQDILQGFRLGADDYITKPFDEDILLARINVLIRRQENGLNIKNGGLEWREEKHQLLYNDKEISLTPKEFQLIGLLMKHPGRVFEREHLIELIWGVDSYTESRTIDSHVRNIRDKIRVYGFPVDDYLKTIWGVGYKWEVGKI
ncbi:DNA-binding response regulator [Halobacillus andaensis]|uniref:DNA-binding response regulator n=1 Tax=Halobacillus andaensis TaxID=1176239 RepID=A0A917B6H8_HALAA|nr:response regulator transcription factor [Halobacillus andaensis]MBP2005858.1 DNA-binding response OmpR family regulator [Halobacillus andaensis]GGF25533.1 DNA-binding response regulator [Halobacillus andaensis]